MHQAFVLLTLLLTSIFTTCFAQTLTVDDFIAEADILSAKVSPNGKYVASTMNIDNKRSVLIYEIENGKVISRFGDNVIRPYDVSWANDNKILVKLLVPYNTSKVRKDSESKDDFDIDDYFMFGRIISADLTGENTVALMNDERTVKRNVNLARITHFLPTDPDHILMSATRREKLTLYKVNVNTGESERLMIGGRFTYAFINDKNGDLLYRYDYRPIAKTIVIYKFDGKEDWNEIDVIYFDKDDGDKNKIDINDLAGIKDGQLVYRKLNEESGYHELILVNDDKKEVLVSLPEKDIVGVITKGINNEVIGYTTLGDVYRSHYFNEETQALYDKVSSNFKGQNFSFSSMAKNRTSAILKSWGTSNPVTYYIYDLVNSKLSKFKYGYPTLPKEKLATGFKVQYKARDNKVITAYLFAPPDFDGSKALPLVMLPHGGPQWRDSMNYSDFTQFISTRGYLVMKPNFRGSTGYGMAFQKAGYKEWGGKMQEDLEDAVTFLVKEGFADPKKVCMVGSSYGGYAALMGAVKTPGMFQCVASINGVSHLPDQIEYDLNKFDSEVLQTFIKKSIGHPVDDAKMLIARSPALQANKIKVPVLLIHGDKDKVVPYEQAQVMEEALEDLNKPVELITLEDTTHSAFRYEEDVIVIYEAIEKFLAEHLGPQD